MSQSVMRSKKCLLSSRTRSQQGLISKYYSDYYIFWTADSLATKLGLMIGYHTARVSGGKIGLLHSRSRSQRRVKMSENVCPDDIFWSAEHFVTNLGSVCVHHHELERHAKRLFCYFQDQGHSKVLYDQNMTVLLYLLNCWSFCCQTWFGSTLS